MLPAAPFFKLFAVAELVAVAALPEKEVPVTTPPVVTLKPTPGTLKVVLAPPPIVISLKTLAALACALLPITMLC